MANSKIYHNRLSRRDFLKMAGLASTGLALSACGVNSTESPALASTSVVPRASTATTPPLAAPTAQPPTLRNLADRVGINFGTLGSSWSINQPDYAETLLKTGNTIMIAGPSEQAEYRLFAKVNWDEILSKWDEVSEALLQGEIPGWIPVDFSRTRITMDFAQTHDLKVFFGHLFWPTTESLPEAVLSSDFSDEDLRRILEFCVRAKATRYSGKIAVWSINEVVSRMLYGTPLEKALFRRLGVGIVEDVIRWARESDPHAQLMFNETHLEQPDNPLFTKISDTTLKLLDEYSHKRVPIDLVGSHFHTWIYDPPAFNVVNQVIAAVKSMGYGFWASEVSVNLADRDPLVPNRKERVQVTGDLLEAQADFYRELLQTILASKGGFILFGFSDSNDDTFTEVYNLPEARAHIYDRNYVPKPAYYALMDVLQKQAGGT